ncbi:MAG: type II secretion system protein GspG [Opitutales bacterium TMED158]|nr:MAG: type II secretion system protein GspG [Opitutales bacterium TMED158]
MKMETKRNRNRYASRRGFTLIEIMLVIGLMVLLFGLVVANVDKIFGDNQAQLVSFKVKESFKTPLTSYRIHMGSFPTTQQGLKALLTRPENDRGRWKGPYIESPEDLVDPWGRELQYRYPGTQNPSAYDLFSLGEDGTESGDDITNW